MDYTSILHANRHFRTVNGVLFKYECDIGHERSFNFFAYLFGFAAAAFELSKQPDYIYSTFRAFLHIFFWGGVMKLPVFLGEGGALFRLYQQCFQF